MVKEGFISVEGSNEENVAKVLDAMENHPGRAIKGVDCADLANLSHSKYVVFTHSP